MIGARFKGWLSRMTTSASCAPASMSLIPPFYWIGSPVASSARCRKTKTTRPVRSPDSRPIGEGVAVTPDAFRDSGPCARCPISVRLKQLRAAARMTMRPVKGIIPKPQVADVRPPCCVENTGNGVGVLLGF